MSSVLLNNLDNMAGGISLTRDKSQKFEMPEYIDLADFVAQLSKRISGSKDVKAATDNVLSALNSSFVMQNAAIGREVERAN